jgi:glycine dehydrogenase subunit 1
MAYKYFPHTKEDIDEMLKVAGADSLAALYDEVPDAVKLKSGYNIPSSMSETEVRRFFKSLENKNNILTCFAGAGVYDHYTPSVINYITQRSEFLTSYTPYQAEISQGTLQYIFEFQTMMADLTGMEVSNASMYDGCTATAEAMLMAVAAAKKRNKVLISSTLNPAVIRVCETYAKVHGVNLQPISSKEGETDFAEMKTELEKGDVAGVIVGQPNYYGIIENLEGIADTCHANKALMIMNCPASTLAVLKTPGEWGADIAVGDGQSLGIPMNFGGPYVGYFCTRQELIRKMPGRIVGGTTDGNGHRTFVLTMQAREQHIRRQKATSNICTNQGLMTLFVTVYLSLMGPQGLKEVNEISYGGAHYLHDELLKTGKFELMFDKPFLNEFCLKAKFDIEKMEKKLLANGIMGGVRPEGMNDCLLFAVTEMRTKEEIDKLVNIINTEA